MNQTYPCYYKCMRCNHISKLKTDMKRHLTKNNKCIIINKYLDKTDYDLEIESLYKHVIKNEILSLSKLEKNNNKYVCNICNKKFSNKSNLNKHRKINTCYDIKKIEINITNQTNNINVINIINNININSLRGFDEDWNISNITDDIKEKLLLSDKKFTNTLHNILQNDDNLNVIIKDQTVGLVYKIKNNEYEAMKVNNIFDEAMNKIYKHLRDFFTDIINNNKNDIRVNILETELKEVNKKYLQYKESTLTNNSVNNCLLNIFDEKKEKAIDNIYKKSINNIALSDSY